MSDSGRLADHAVAEATVMARLVIGRMIVAVVIAFVSGGVLGWAIICGTYRLGWVAAALGAVCTTTILAVRALWTLVGPIRPSREGTTSEGS